MPGTPGRPDASLNDWLPEYRAHGDWQHSECQLDPEVATCRAALPGSLAAEIQLHVGLRTVLAPGAAASASSDLANLPFNSWISDLAPVRRTGQSESIWSGDPCDMMMMMVDRAWAAESSLNRQATLSVNLSASTCGRCGRRCTCPGPAGSSVDVRMGEMALKLRLSRRTRECGRGRPWAKAQF